MATWSTVGHAGAMEPLHVQAGAVVVGVDGSSDSDRALDWAITQAVLEHRPLTLVHAMQVLGTGEAGWIDVSGVIESSRARALEAGGRAILTAASARAHRAAPDLVLSEVLTEADPRNALLDQASAAAVVVVGSRGRGPVSRLLLGSVSVAVSKHARCPVVIVRPSDVVASRQGVLVGVNDSVLDRPVVDFAFRMAALRAVPLTVVHCVWEHVQGQQDRRVVADDEPGFEGQRRVLQDAVRDLEAKFPEVELHLELARGFADQHLIRGSHEVDLVVVGSRRTSLLQEIVYGSLAPTVVEHAGCNVGVVPTDVD